MGTRDSASLKIGGNNDEAQKAIAETLRTLEKMGVSINVQSATAVKAFRSEADAARELLTQLGASDKQMQALGRTTQRVEAQASAHLSRIGGAARMMASGFEGMARTGNVAGEATKAVIASGAEMAMTFGAMGPIVGAVGIAGLAIYSFFERTKKEAAALAKQAEDDMIKVARARDILQSGEKLRSLTSGDIGAQELKDKGLLSRELTPEELGIAGLQRRIADRRASVGASPMIVGTGPGGHTQDPNADIRQQILDDETALNRLIEQRTKYEQIYNIDLGHANDLAQSGLTVAKYLADKEKEKAALSKEASRELQLAEENKKAAVERYVAGISDSIALTGKLAAIANDETRSWNERVAAARQLEEIEARRAAAAKKRREEEDKAYNKATTPPSQGGPVILTPEEIATIQASGSGPGKWMDISSAINGAAEANLRLAAGLASTTSLMNLLGDTAAQAFMTFGSGAQSAGQVAKTALLDFVSEEAMSLGKFFLFRSIADVGDAIVYRDPSFLVAAGEHAAASAGFFALGAAGAYNSRPHTGGGGGARTGASDRQAIGDVRAAPGEIKIYGGLLDTSDTRQMDALAQGVSALAGRGIIITRA